MGTLEVLKIWQHCVRHLKKERIKLSVGVQILTCQVSNLCLVHLGVLGSSDFCLQPCVVHPCGVGAQAHPNQVKVTQLTFCGLVIFPRCQIKKW